MRRLLFLLLFSLILAACTNGQPSLVLGTEKLELGDVVNGEIVSQEVAVRNEGDAPLVVEAVSTSCGCTQATLEPMTIQPGGSAVLHIEFDSGAHGPDLTGMLVRQVFIASNDPELPEAVLAISANILPP
ncbi:MAG: DUF1573 domain-containing protein [Anaerolineales bacterium]